MNPRAEGLVKLLGPVGRQEQDALEPLEGAQEDGDEGVARDVVALSPGEEDVGLVEEHDGVPGLGDAEDGLEL